jgi:hypothetical protein
MSRKLKVLGPLALCGLAAALMLSLVDGGKAQLDPGSKAFFGLIGIAPGQTLRLAVVNVGEQAPPVPDKICLVRLGFVDLSGQPLQPTVAVRLPPGAGGVADLGYAELGRSGRIEVHPLADVPRGQPGAQFCAIDVVAEVIDDASGRTEVYVLPVVPET